MGLLCPHLVAYFFDGKGLLLADEHRPWTTPAPTTEPNGPYDIYDAAFEKAFAKQMRQWKSELGFRPGTIKIRAFLDDRHPVGITLFPDHLNPDEIGNLDEDEQRAFAESRAEWIAEGQFVWWWAKDYEMAKDGEVEST
jgi:hypothetical protein